tara:strand:+ start:5265 stop:6530 length:1266 start_codon:yes stop_codon:yes gene_type:complete
MPISFLNKDNNYFKIIFFTVYYIFFITAFYINEDSTGGAFNDYIGYKNLIDLFINDFKETLLTFDQFGERHSPVTIILLSQFYKTGLSDELIRFFFFNTSIISVIFFYKCLKIKFQNTKTNYLFLIALTFFLSPIVRSLSVWPDSRIFGFLFFIISVYFYLKYFYLEKKIIYSFLNLFFLALASYFSLNFCLFGIYFFFKFFKELNIKKKIFHYLIICFVLIFPAFYYLFILDIFFINPGLTPGNDINSLGINNSLNFSNKILIISSIIFFYSLPFIIYFKKFFLLKNLYLKEILILLIFSLINIYLFNYKIEFTGGGILFKISNFLFDNNLIFFCISIYSILFIFLLFKPVKNLNNFLILFLLLISNPQLSIYHKYYDPLLLFLFFTIFEININKDYFNFSNILILNVFCFTFLAMSFLK